jgi:hypothetical protein
VREPPREPEPVARTADTTEPTTTDTDTDDRFEPPAARDERSGIPDIASLDTLLPDRAKGGSINPRR